MAGTQRFQKAAFRANPCIISTGVEPSHGHRKSSTMQWTEAPSGRAMRGIFNSFGFQLRISKPIIEQSEEKWRVEYPPGAPWPADRGVASSRGVLHEARKAWRVERDGLDECGRRGRVRQTRRGLGYSAKLSELHARPLGWKPRRDRQATVHREDIPPSIIPPIVR